MSSEGWTDSGEFAIGMIAVVVACVLGMKLWEIRMRRRDPGKLQRLGEKWLLLLAKLWPVVLVFMVVRLVLIWKEWRD